MRATWIVCLCLAAAASVSCGKKPEAPPSEGTVAPTEEAAPPADKPGDPGIIDAAGQTVDYLIGKTQLEAKKRIESQLDDIQKEQKRRLEEALGE